MFSSLKQRYFELAELRRDVYFRRDFVELHSKHGTLGLDGESFSHATAIQPILGDSRYNLETAWGYGGPVATDECTLAAGFSAWKDVVGRQGNVVAEFIRFHPFLDPAGICESLDILRFNRSVVIAELFAEKERRWKRYSDSTRSSIRKADRNLSYRRLGPSEGKLFQSLYEAGLERNEAHNEYYLEPNFYEQLVRQDWCHAWVALDSEGPVAVACFLHADFGVCHYHLAGGLNRARQTNANYLLLDVAMEHFALEGVRYMCLGGGRSDDPNDALFKFKSKFSALRVPYFIGGIVHNRVAYKTLPRSGGRFLRDGLARLSNTEALDIYPRDKPMVDGGEIASRVATHLVSNRENRKCYLLGDGGHAKVLGALARSVGISIDGRIGSGRVPGDLTDVWWLGVDGELHNLDPETVYLINGIGSVSSLNRRRLVFERAKAMGFSFLTLVHPTAIIEDGVVIGEGAQVMAGAILQTGVSVGVNTIVNSGAIVDHDCQLGPHCHIATGVRLSGNVRLTENIHVGTGASIIQGVQINANTVIGAGAAVISSVDSFERVGGVPAVPLREKGYELVQEMTFDLWGRVG